MWPARCFRGSWHSVGIAAPRVHAYYPLPTLNYLATAQPTVQQTAVQEQLGNVQKIKSQNRELRFSPVIFSSAFVAQNLGKTFFFMSRYSVRALSHFSSSRCMLVSPSPLPSYRIVVRTDDEGGEAFVMGLEPNNTIRTKTAQPTTRVPSIPPSRR